MKKLNNTEQALLDFIVEYKRSNDGNSPSTREIADSLGYSSTSTAHIHLGRLADKGWISLGSNKKRQIQVVGGIWMMGYEMLDLIKQMSEVEQASELYKGKSRFIFDEADAVPDGVWGTIEKVRQQE